MQSNAFWISPKNDIIPVDQKHITLIVTHPEKFGLDKDYIIKIHKKYKEVVGQEGDARNEIMSDLIKNGWIRVRIISNNYSIKFQVSDHKENTIIRVVNAIKKGYKAEIFNGNYSVNILDLNAKDFIEPTDELTVKEVSLGALNDKKYQRRLTTGYTSLVRQYHESRKFKILKSIEEYTHLNY